jgi:CBS domain-containing protein
LAWVRWRTHGADLRAVQAISDLLKGLNPMTAKSSSPTAADVMQRDVITVREGDTLQEAMQLMTENHVTGLPVMSSKGRCVGVVTASDILSYEQDHSEFTSQANTDMARHFNPDTQQWESVRVTSYALEEFAEVRVAEVMSRDLISVRCETPLAKVAKKMCDEKVHRVLVLDDEFRLYGIISAFDFVKLYAGGV